MSGQIFLYSSGGRTLWVPRHTPSPNETKPVCMLNFVTPMELSRSFYLFDYPVQVVDNAQLAAMNPNAKTPNEVLAAVNDFRRVCAEDQSFLLQRCYNQQQPQHQSPQPQLQQPQQQQHFQGSYPQAMPSSSMGGVAPGYGGGNVVDNAALLAQLLQQQQQQQQPTPMMGNSHSGSFPDLGSGSNLAYSGSFGDGTNNNSYNSNYNNNNGSYRGGRGQRRGGGGMYNNNVPYTPGMMQQQQPNQMMGGGYNNNAPYPMMNQGLYSNNNRNMSGQRGGRNGNRQDRQAYGNYGNQMMMMPNQQQQMMMGGVGGHGNMNGQDMAMRGRVAPPTRKVPEPINITVAVPDEIKSVYMNPTQQLVIATMPGPHMTVWLREHPIPTDTMDKKYVFGRNGLILMLKAAFEEVKDSKPVELFPKQICTHFFIYNYCCRENCFHEHHSEQQLRELIAARHVELKAMTKTQRHELINQIEAKDTAGRAAVAAQQAEREKRRADYLADREMRREQRKRMREPLAGIQQMQPMQQQQQQTPYVVSTTQSNPAQDIGSDKEDDGSTLGGQTQSLSDITGGGASQEVAGKTPSSDAIARLGITDSDDGEDDKDDDDDASSSSANSGSEESEESEEEEEEEEEEEPAPKKRARASSSKTAAKSTKK